MEIRNNEIHVTDVNAFLRCRRMWNWQSLLRRGLQPAEIPAALFLGQGVHVALDVYYKAMIQDYPVQPQMSYLLQAFNDWADERAEKIEERTGALWESEKEMIEEQRQLGLGMLEHYYLWAKEADKKWEFVSTEELFDVPLPTPSGQRSVLGRLVRRFIDKPRDLRYAGRFDGIVRELETGDLYLMEFKTTSRMYNMRYNYRNFQGKSYVWAARQIYGDQIKGIVYRALLKKVPTDPVPLKRGGFSKAKSQKTTFLWLKHRFAQIAEDRGVDPKTVYKENEDLLRTFYEQENEFFEERVIHPPDERIEHTMRAIYHLGHEMVDPDTPTFPQPGFHCNWCSFSDPCSMKDNGLDYNAVLDAEYAPRGYWEGNEDDD